MSAIATPAPISTLARFVIGDIKGGAAAHAFRTDTIRTAIEQLFKGNYEPVNEATPLTAGKAKKARAYAAGFATFGVIGTDLTKVPYVGKLSDVSNREARDRIASLTQHHTATFFAAFDAIMAEKAPAKASATTPAAAPAPTPTPAAESTPEQVADTARHNAAVMQDEAVLSIVNMIASGMLTGEQMDAIDAALQAVELRNAIAAAAAAEGYAVEEMEVTEVTELEPA